MGDEAVTPPQIAGRADREVAHGRKLAAEGAEDIWGWGSPAGQRRAERRAKLIAQAAKLGPGVRALEIGCGTGLFTEKFARTGAHVLAVDISPDLLVIARQRGLPESQVQFVEQRFEDSDAQGPFDAVVGSSVLHHLELRPAVERIFQLLRPGGWMSFAEPNMLNPQIAIQKNVGWIKRRAGDSDDETAIVRWRFARMLREVGFERIAITPHDWLHPLTPRPLIGAVATVGRVLEAIPGVREFAGSVHIVAARPSA